MLLLGIAAVVRSVAATVVSMLFFGWLLVLASGIEIAQAVMVGHWAGFFQHLLAAILFGVAGLCWSYGPVISGEVPTVFMAHVLPGRRAVSNTRLAGARFSGMGLAGGWTGSSRLCWACSSWPNGRPPDCG